MSKPHSLLDLKRDHLFVMFDFGLCSYWLELKDCDPITLQKWFFNRLIIIAALASSL